MESVWDGIRELAAVGYIVGTTFGLVFLIFGVGPALVHLLRRRRREPDERSEPVYRPPKF